MIDGFPRTQLIGAVTALSAGIFSGVMIYLHPEGLRVPAWVAYAAASAFVLAGLCLLAIAFEVAWLQRWLGVAVALSLFVVSVWVAFGPGTRECSMSIAFVQTIAPDTLCRAAFGAGSLVTGLLLGLIVHRALQASPET